MSDAARRFLRAIIPWEAGGYCTIHWGQKAPTHIQSCKTLDQALDCIKNLLPKRVDIFFCVSCQKLEGKRSRENTLAIAVAFMDLDVKEEGYKSAADAAVAVAEFCKHYEIPFPSAMVLSGAGLHCYWLADKHLTVEEWQPFADALKAAMKEADLKADIGLSGNAACVLRPPGTWNYKYTPAKPVVLIEKYSTWQQHDFTKIFRLPARQGNGKGNGKWGPLAEGFKHVNQPALGAGIEFEKRPLHLEPILKGCGWLHHVHATGGADQREPLWYQMVRCCTYLENGYELAHQLGHQHPGYSTRTTDEKWEHALRDSRNKNLGWPSCGIISDKRPECRSCPNFGGGDRSPVTLANEAARAKQQEEQQKAILSEVNGVAVTNHLFLPDGYQEIDGIICHINTGKKAKKLPYMRLFKTELSRPVLVFDKTQLGIALIATSDRGHSQPVTLWGSDFYSNSMGAIFAKQSVYIEDGPEVMKMVRKFGPSWIEKLRKEFEATPYEGTFGWRRDYNGDVVSFAFGTTLYKVDGTSETLGTSYMDELRRWYQPRGKKEPWLAAAKLIIDRKRPELDAILAIPFAAPLMALCGDVYGGIICVWGLAGSGKSVAQKVAAAVHGQPKQVRESMLSTVRSISHRMGIIRNLPCYWDDIQDERHQENLFTSMFASTEGSEHGRLNTDRSYTERKEWQTILTSCANSSFVEFVLRKQKSTTAGLRRVFEIQLQQRGHEYGMIDPFDASRIFAALDHNYGVAGAEYAALLTQKYEQISKLVREVVMDFKDSVQGTPDEIYWWSMCGCLIAGAMLATQIGLRINYEMLKKFLQAAYFKNRELRGEEGTEGGTYLNTAQAIGDFLNHYIGAGNSIYTATAWKINEDVKVEHHPLQRCTIYIQVIGEERKILISQRMLREYLHKNNIQMRQVIDGLKEHFSAKRIKATLGAGTGYRQAQEVVYEIPVPVGDQLLEGVLTKS